MSTTEEQGTASVSQMKRTMAASKEPTGYSSQCAALHVKPNSRVVEKVEGMHNKEKIDLNLNYLGGAGFQALVDTLAKNEKLETLIVSNNGLSNTSVVFFCRAMSDHPSLKMVDFSNNPLSLPAGLALIDLVHRNPRIEEIILNQTHIEEAVLRRLRRSLNLNKVPHKTPATNAAGQTPFQKAQADHDRKTAPRKEAAEKAKVEREAQCTEKITEWLKGHRGEVQAPERRDGGWAVVNIAIDCPPTDFKTELDIIHNVVIPQLNQRFAARKIHFVPMAMHSDIPSNYHETPAVPSFRKAAVPTEYKRWLECASPFVVHLVGDRIGLIEQPKGKFSNNTQQPFGGGGKGSPKGNPTTDKETQSSCRPIQELNYEEAKKLNHGCSIVMIREPSQKLGLPVSLLPLMSDQPQVVFPDAHAAMVKVAVAEAQGMKHKLAGFDMELLKKRWNDHLNFLRRLNTEHDPAFVVHHYPASYEGIDEYGCVKLKELEHFSQCLVKRLVAMTNVFYPRAHPSKTLAADSLNAKNWIMQSVDIPLGKRHLVGKLELYTVTPPSRNMTLIYAPPGSGNSTVLRAYVKRNQVKPTYLLASYFVQQPTICDEPTDLRSVFLTLIAQLSADRKVPGYIANEVDIVKIKEQFQVLLAKTASELPEGHTIILAVDAMEAIDNAMIPSESLRITETGVDAWNPPPSVTTVQPRPPKSVAPKDRFDWIPICLSRNVRVIGSTSTNSPAHNILGQRGHDSCEPLFAGELGDNDVEAIILNEATAMGWDADDDQIGIIRGKVDSRSPEYLKLVFDAVRQSSYTATYSSNTTGLLQQLPHTIDEMCARLLRGLEHAAGPSLAKQSVSLLLVSRWGLLESELRELLAKHIPLATAKTFPSLQTLNTSATPSGKTPLKMLNCELFECILRYLRPVLQLPVGASAASVVPGAMGPVGLNALDRLLFISSATFRQVATRRYLTVEGDVINESSPATAEGQAVAVPAAIEVHHHHLGHYFGRIAQLESHPRRARALKEMPYHLCEASMWTTFEAQVVCLEYVSAAYEHGLGYQALREMVRAYNKMDKIQDPTVATQGLMHKLKEYVYFVRDNNVNLVQYPHMVHQIAITSGTDTHVHKDARHYFKTQSNQPHFAVVNKTKGKLHRERITGCQFAPSGLRFATCSEDRGVRICGLNGEPLLSINQSASRLIGLSYSRTSRYLVAVAEDHSILTFDASTGSLVSKATGHTAPIGAIALSTRGRFVLSGGEDRTMRVWESETGVLIANVSHVPFAHHTSAYGGVSQVETHPLEEDRFFSICDRKLFGWKMAASRDSCDQTHCIAAHNTLPIASFHLIYDGQFVITTCRDLSAPTPGTVRSEDNVKVWSLVTGRCVASMSMGLSPESLQHGPIFSAVSPTEDVLATALGDGTMQLHQLDVRSFAPEGEEPMVVTPYRHFPAYLDHPTPKLSIIRFSFDSRYVCATGNLRQLKVWSALRDGMALPPTATPQPAAEENAEGPGADEEQSPAAAAAPLAKTDSNEALNADAESTTEEQSKADAAKAEEQKLRPVAEFLVDQPSTCMDWTPSPTDDGAELIVGDSVGRLRALRLRQ